MRAKTGSAYMFRIITAIMRFATRAKTSISGVEKETYWAVPHYIRQQIILTSVHIIRYLIMGRVFAMLPMSLSIVIMCLSRVGASAYLYRRNNCF